MRTNVVLYLWPVWSRASSLRLSKVSSAKALAVASKGLLWLLLRMWLDPAAPPQVITQLSFAVAVCFGLGGAIVIPGGSDDRVEGFSELGLGPRLKSRFNLRSFFLDHSIVTHLGSYLYQPRRYLPHLTSILSPSSGHIRSTSSF